MLNSFVYNNKLFFEDFNLNDFYINNTGLNFIFNYNLIKRFEKIINIKLNELDKSEIEIFYIYIFNIIPKNSYFLKKFFLNIIILDSLTTYRGWRHFKGLPVRGQRTWSNSWSVYKSNNILRQFKFKNSKIFYGNVPLREANVAYSAEYVNLLWKIQWLNEWASAK